MKNCPFCSEEIQDEAIKCRHCDSFLNEKEVSESEYEPESEPESESESEFVTQSQIIIKAKKKSFYWNKAVVNVYLDDKHEGVLGNTEDFILQVSNGNHKIQLKDDSWVKTNKIEIELINQNLKLELDYKKLSGWKIKQI